MLKKLVAITLLINTAQPAALEIDGVTIPEYETLLDPGNHVELNGVGLVNDSPLNTYIGALYLKKKSSKLETILATPGSKRILLHFLSDGVKHDQLIRVWTEGFKNNLSSEQFSAIQPRLEKFNAMFRTINKGKVIFLDYHPTIGTEVHINDDITGSIKGEDFFQALLKIWLGHSPVDNGLKKAMLGIKED